MLGHLGAGRPRGGGRLVSEQRRLPESLDLADVQAFLAALRTHRVQAMALSGLPSAEVRGLLLAVVGLPLARALSAMDAAGRCGSARCAGCSLGTCRRMRGSTR
jgi:hypothetical protein